MSKMTKESAVQKHLIFIYLLILPVFTTADVDIGHGKEIPRQYTTFCSNQSSSPTRNKVIKRSTEPCSNTKLKVNTKLKDKGTFIESDLTIFFSMNRTSANQCLKNKLREIINSEVNNHNPEVTDNPCNKLTQDESFAFEYLQTDKNTVLWYPIIQVKNESRWEMVSELFQNCSKLLDMPTLPWQCGFQNDTRNYSKTLMYLRIYKQAPLKHCEDLLCKGSYSHLSNVTFINLTDSTADLCKTELEPLPQVSCSENDTLCFRPFNIPYIQKAIAFITKDTNDLTETQKIVTILRNFTMLKDSPWCKYPLDYTTQGRIIQNVYQTFFYCFGDPNGTDTSDSWVFAHIFEKESIVALNGNVNNSIIPSNPMLQALIATNVTINTTVYRSFETSNITLKNHTELFNIPVFNDNQSAFELLQKIKVENCTVKNNTHFTTLVDSRSIWSPLNWIIFHNCPDHGGDKNLYLFWHNHTDILEIERICNENTVVLLTSIRRANVTFIDIKRVRTCTDGSLHTNNSEHCQSLIKDGSDYETRFFQFLVYPANLDRASLITEIASKFEEGNTNQIFLLSFGFNTHPDLMGGILNLNKTIESNNNENTCNGDKKLECHGKRKSIQKILQIFVIANLTNNTPCLEDIKKDIFSIIITNVYIIIPGAEEVSSASCLKILPLGILQDLKTIFFNKFWPTCSYNQIFASNDEGKSEWDYLPDSCKSIESILFGIVCMVTITTITGNILVITIIFASKLYKKHAFMLYMSLALADLLIGITTSLQAVIDTYALMNGQLTMYNLTNQGPLENFNNIADTQLKGFKDLKFRRRDEWAAFTGIAMNISIMSSLMSLALLGIDRLLMLKMLSFKDKHIKIAIITTWIWNIICSLLISIKVDHEGEGGFVVGYFDPITKLTLNIGTNEASVSSVVFKTQLFVGGIAGIVVVTASIASLIVYNFVELRNNQQAIRIHDQRRGEKIQVVTRTFLMMVLLFLVSCSPIAYAIITKTFTKGERDFPIHPVFHFIIWWLCVAGSSWNWLIYSFRGTYFKQEAKKVWHKCV